MHSSHLLVKLACCLTLIISGCAAATQYTGKAVAPEQTIPLENASRSQQVWQTKDLLLNYTIESNGAAYLIKGDVTIDSSISYTFANVDVLNIYGYLLDASDTVLDRRTADIRYIRFSRFPDNCRFQLLLPKNDSPVSFAFGYDGVFTNRTARPIRSLDREDRNISFRPFLK